MVRQRSKGGGRVLCLHIPELKDNECDDNPRHAIFPADHRYRALAHAIEQAVGLKGQGGVGADLKNQASVGLKCVHLHSSLTGDVAALAQWQEGRTGQE